MRYKLLVTISIALVIAGCGNPIPSSDDRICDGVAAEVGGCDPDQPTFTGTTCDEVAAEFGIQLDERLLDVINGPEVADNESRGVRMSQAMSLMTTRANDHLRGTGMIDDCADAEAFALAAEAEFSAQLRERAGSAIYDGTAVTYAEFRAELLRMLSILEMEL